MARARAVREVRSARYWRHAAASAEACRVQRLMPPRGLPRDQNCATSKHDRTSALRGLSGVVQAETERRPLLLGSL
jgi:hypothetical protein